MKASYYHLIYSLCHNSLNNLEFKLVNDIDSKRDMASVISVHAPYRYMKPGIDSEPVRFSIANRMYASRRPIA